MRPIHRKALFALSVALLITCLSTSLTFAQTGAWTLVSSPNQGTLGNQLFGVAAVSASNIWAVGDYNDGPFKHDSLTLIQHWNGSSWSIVSSPNPVTGAYNFDRLQAVAAVSASNVWAVGYYGSNNSGNTKTLIEHWNGASWNVVASPNPTVSQDLYGVAIVSANDIWAVGYYTDQQSQAGSGSLTLHWNGTTWSQVSNPGTSSLLAVAGVASNDVWAVGTQILHWNGTQWSIVSNFTPYLTAIAAVSANDIWAVGFEGEYYSYPRIQHWNGTAWSEVYPPYRYDEDNIFYGVAVLSPTSVWAVGLSGGQSLVEKWNGNRWAIVPSPNTNDFDVLQAATAIPATSTVWAVGEYFKIINNASVHKTLTEQCISC